MSNFYRALCAELLVDYDNFHYRSELSDRAHALLAQPEPSELTDEEIEEWADACYEVPLEEMDPEVHGWRRCFTSEEFSKTIRAALVRWGRPTPQPPADGEVAELVAALRKETEGWFHMKTYSYGKWASKLTRAATLLEQLSAQAPQPVAVSERLPGPEDCDAEGRCWWWRTDDADEWWELLCIRDAREYNAGCGNARYTHWLPAHALPLPTSEEVEA